MRLTTLQRRFVDEYLVDQCATAAAQRAGYRVDRGGVWWVTRNPKIKQALDSALADRADRLAVRPDEVIDELRKIAFAPESVIKARERMAAIALLGKHLGMFRGKPEPGPKEDPFAAFR